MVLNYYNLSKEDIIVKNKEVEILNSLLNFRNSLLDITLFINSNLTYQNKYDSNLVLIFLNNTTISGVDTFLNSKINVSISSLGLRFCQNYNFSPIKKTIFNFNGSCIKKLN